MLISAFSEETYQTHHLATLGGRNVKIRLLRKTFLERFVERYISSLLGKAIMYLFRVFVIPTFPHTELANIILLITKALQTNESTQKNLLDRAVD